MSTIIMAQCWTLDGMSAPQKAVLISLADQANDDGVCWPSVGTIARRTSLSQRAVQEALSWLQTTGAVFREYKPNSSTVYKVTPSSYSPAKAPKKRGRATGAAGAPPADGAPHAQGAPLADGAPPPAHGASGGACGAPLGVQEAHPNHQWNRQLTANESLHPAPKPAAAPKKGADVDQETELQAACRETWRAYKEAYAARYGADPVRNAQVNTKVKQFVQLIGYDESPAVARFFVKRVNEAFVTRQMHDVGLLVKGASAYRTQWATNTTMTGTRARQMDQSQANYDAADEAVQILRNRQKEGSEC